jgi:hypothetical protein
VLGSCTTLVALSWLPLWRVERPTDKLSEISNGSFLEFLNNLPRAVENLSVPQTPETILTILPTACLAENLSTTSILLAVGAAFGLAAWKARQWGRGGFRHG